MPVKPWSQPWMTLSHAERELEVLSGVELLPLVVGRIGIVEPTRVVDGDGLPDDGLVTSADSKIGGREWDIGRSRRWRVVTTVAATCQRDDRHRKNARALMLTTRWFACSEAMVNGFSSFSAANRDRDVLYKHPPVAAIFSREQHGQRDNRCYCSSQHGSEVIILASMKKRFLPCVIALVSAGACSSRQPPRSPGTPPSRVDEGLASWYAKPRRSRTRHGERRGHGTRKTDRAHKIDPSLRLARARGTDLDTGKHVEVIINDRGPFVGGRIIDLRSRRRAISASSTRESRGCASR